MASVIGQFFKNVFTTWAGMAVSMAVAFFFTPYLIDMLGKKRYGIWNLAFSVIAYLGLTDLGLKQSIVRYISKYLATKDWKQLNEVYSSSIKIYFFVALLIVLATISVVFYFIKFFKIDPEYVEIAQIVIFTLGINEAFTYACLPLNSLGAYHRFDITAYFKIGRLVIQTIGIIVLLEMGYGLISMAYLVVALNFGFIFGLNAIRRRLFPENRFSFKHITRDKTKLLLNYGLYSFMIVGAWIVIFQSDNIIIGTYISMEAVAVYSIAGMLITQIRGAIQVIAVPLVPAISHFDAEDDQQKIVDIYHKSTRYMYYISSFLAIAILIFGGPFILLWVDKGFIETIQLLHILIIPAAIYLPQTIANSVLFGISKHKIAFYVLLGEAVSKITLSIILLKYYGIVGVAIGTAVPQAIIYTFIYPYVFHRTMSADLMRFYKTAATSIFFAIIFVLPTAWIMNKLLAPDNWYYFFADCIIVSVIMLIGFYFFILEKEDRDRFIIKLKEKIKGGKSGK